MKIREKIMLDRSGLTENGPINIVIFGDSISHGSFNGYIDYESVYWNRLRRMLNGFRSYMPVNMICAAIGGTSAEESLARLDSQVLKHEPDLVIVCFGLNDVNGTLESYLSSLKTVFERCSESGADVIFMTPNMLNTYVAEDTPKEHYEYAIKTARMQSNGRMDEFIGAAVALAKECGVAVCDCYAKWKELSATEDTTLLLENRINHPSPEMHKLFAESLYEMILGEEGCGKADDSTMFGQ